MGCGPTVLSYQRDSLDVRTPSWVHGGMFYTVQCAEFPSAATVIGKLPSQTFRFSMLFCFVLLFLKGLLLSR